MVYMDKGLVGMDNVFEKKSVFCVRADLSLIKVRERR